MTNEPAHGIKQVQMWKTPDGRTFETYDHAVWHEKRYGLRERLIPWLTMRGVKLSEEHMGHVLDFIMKELEE